MLHLALKPNVALFIYGKNSDFYDFSYTQEIFYVSLQKIGYTRQFESKHSLPSLALSLHKTILKWHIGRFHILSMQAHTTSKSISLVHEEYVSQMLRRQKSICQTSVITALAFMYILSSRPTHFSTIDALIT